MKNKKGLSVLFILGLFVITGCGNKAKESSEDTSKSASSTNEIKAVLSCSNEGYLFHSKKSVEHIMSLDKNNKLIKYEHIEKYYDFDDDNDFEMICTGSEEEEVNNNKIYPYLKETADCNRDSKEVKISDVYYISKIDSKNKLRSDELKESLTDDYILDVESYKTAIGNKGYICEKK